MSQLPHATREQLIQLGVCCVCRKSDALPTSRFCKACRIATNKRQNDNRLKYLALGICPRCKERPTGDKGQRCEPCREKFNAYQVKRNAGLIAAGRCVTCRKPSKRTRCRRCRMDYGKDRKRPRATGQGAMYA